MVRLTERYSFDIVENQKEFCYNLGYNCDKYRTYDTDGEHGVEVEFNYPDSHEKELEFIRALAKYYGGTER